MAKIRTGKGEIFLIHDKISKADAEKRILNKKTVFGFISSLISKENLVISKYQKQLIPFWVLEGSSLFEYTRRTRYEVDVKPEVRSLKIIGKVHEVEEDVPIVGFEAEDHCFESYSKRILQNGMGGKDRVLELYAKQPQKRVRAMDLYKKDVQVIQPSVKASYLLRELVKDLIKPFDADRVLKEELDIKTMKLIFRPIHVFEVKHGHKTNTLSVNAVTGTISKAHPIADELKSTFINEDTIFDVGAELASMVVPGLGVGVVLTKNVKDRIRKRRKLAEMKSSKLARKKAKK